MLPLILFGAAYLISRTTKETTEFADGGTLGAGSFAKGGETFTEKADSLKGGIKYYSIDIDTEDGEQIRDLQFKSLEKATKEYKKYKATMEYDGEPIDDIQLIKVFKNGDYESIGGEVMAKGGSTKSKFNGYITIDNKYLTKAKMDDVYKLIEQDNFYDNTQWVEGNKTNFGFNFNGQENKLNEKLKDLFSKLKNINVVAKIGDRNEAFADGGTLGAGSFAKGGEVMAKGGVAQGYNDREDERLAMKHGKISSKDFVGSRKAKEHSRRDDAMFEERKK
jgi:hypothetical protein